MILVSFRWTSIWWLLLSTFIMFTVLSGVSRRLTVRAFITTASTNSKRSARIVASTTCRPGNSPYYQDRLIFFSTKATVEEELDTVLDDMMMLGHTVSSSKVENGTRKPGTHIEGSKPMPKILVEKVRLS